MSDYELLKTALAALQQVADPANIAQQMLIVMLQERIDKGENA